jgi:hypothetical protein
MHLTLRAHVRGQGDDGWSPVSSLSLSLSLPLSPSLSLSILSLGLQERENGAPERSMGETRQARCRMGTCRRRCAGGCPCFWVPRWASVIRFPLADHPRVPSIPTRRAADWRSTLALPSLPQATGMLLGRRADQSQDIPKPHMAASNAVLEL